MTVDIPEIKQIGGSFRDPDGYVYVLDGIVYRQVNQSYRTNYDRLLSSGLYAVLTDRQLLIPHTEIDHPLVHNKNTYKILRPEKIPFISYPYEWSFSQLKDAALATLDIQKRALAHHMILKDASAYNIQFLNGKPILIDTLSFQEYREGEAWIAYKQFCQHFLAPLVLMSHKDIRLNQLLRIYIDGIPLDLATSLLPKRTYLNLGIVMHLHLHARAQRRYAKIAQPTNSKSSKRLGRQALLNITDSLRSAIQRLKWDHGDTSWAGYYEGDSYHHEGFNDKNSIVNEYLSIINPECVWDLGANTGVFSRIASQRGSFTVSIDSDPGVVEANYLQTKEQKERKLLPLLIDFTNPSARIGWANNERESLAERSNADCVMALALIHHLAISNNVPLAKIADFFASLAEWLIIEFVPKTDRKVQQLLASREDVFEEYNQAEFERSFGEKYEIIRSQQIRNSSRNLYLLRHRGHDTGT